MVKELIHDPIFLARKSEPAGKEDLQTAQDLLDTLMAHQQTCVGMAANMIGVCKRIIAFEGFTAQIIQHEIDHCNGILI